jgi:hypothetical protein
MQSKVENYIAGLYRKTPRAGLTVHCIFHMLLPFVGCCLGVWSLFFGGPDRALTAAQAITWCYLAINAFFMGCLAAIGVMRRIIITRNPVLADTLLFSNTKTPTILKISYNIDTPLVMILALYAGWVVVGSLLIILFALEITSKNIIKINQQARKNELEKFDEADLQAALVSPEEEMAMRDQINKMFGQS